MDIQTRIPLTNDYMFGYVMHQPGICRRVVQCLLPWLSISDVVFHDSPDIQKTLRGSMGSHSVRLDVYLEGGNEIINVEMQTGRKIDLPKRMRYYTGQIDCDQLKKAQRYQLLKPTYILFICTFDPFGLDQYCYSFENTCAEIPGLKLGDEAYKIFFNAGGHQGNIPEEMKKLLGYFDHPGELQQQEETELIRDLDALVDFANHDTDWRRDYMTYEQSYLDAVVEGEARGIEKGEILGSLKTLFTLVKKGYISIRQASGEAGMTEEAFAALLNKA